MKSAVLAYTEVLAYKLLNGGNEESTHSCAACGARNTTSLYAIVFGQPVAVCDVECVEMLRANWQPITGRV
jgi:hypothetical protein